ncbi:PREDICTED: guanine nucleotide-binding protein-like 3 homolog [Theobroma cacao]|uniref:Guanine nucleotide-binding protein-like 3 homolog n=1 Tax=Theobroma cacao TaxID=3641 RepID=A0AB32WX19_THECC|nr:PREDICTED: guanine nucleotide-binding protein-like 3 homolog [Theobroma cacao]
MNSGVCIKGSFYNDYERDFYGILVDIIELEYFGIGNKVVLFKCHWFDIEKVLVSGVYKVVNLLNEDEEDDIQGDEDEEDDMEGDEEEEEEEKEKKEVEDEDEETCCDDSGTMVKRKHSKPKPRATNASVIMSLPSNASVFADLSTRAQMQQINDMPSEPPSLLATSAEQEDNETFTHDSSRSTSIDLGASVDGSSSRLRGRGLDVGLQTSIDPSERLLITPVGER